MANNAVANTNCPSAKDIRDEISRLLKQLASPVQPGELPKACIRRASQRSGLDYGVVRRHWYGLVKDPKATITDRIRARAAAHDKRLQASMYHAIVKMQEADPDYFSDCIEETGAFLFPDRERVPVDGSVD